MIERGWTQGVSARSSGSCVAFDNPQADCWCAAGAIGNVAMKHDTMGWRQLYSDALTHANNVVRRSDPRAHLMMWNDALGRTQAEVVALLRECARVAQ